MTKMAPIAINSKKPLKQFLPRSRSPMILKLSLKHQAIEFYKVGIHHNAGMTLTYFMAGQLRSPMHLNGENKLNVIK